MSDSKDATSSDTSSQTSQVTRRSSTRSMGSADRRRVAVVEMDPPAEEEAVTSFESSHDPSHTLRSRRGLHSSLSGLAIVAPPDSSKKSFFLLSPPPSTAPLTATASDPHTPQASQHQRSTSEIIPHKKTRSRDIGIVGTAQLTSSGVKQQGTTTNKILPDMHAPDNNNNATLHPPIFQRPKPASPSPSPSPSPEPTRSVVPVPIHGLNVMKREKSKEPVASHLVSAKDAASSSPSSQLMPEIGEEKDVNGPVAPPIDDPINADAVVGGIRLVTQSKPAAEAPVPAKAPSITNTTSPPTLVLPTTDSTIAYVNYQPGVHSTAGPLPPPPRLPGFNGLTATPTAPPPPRPPRLNSPLPPRNAARSKDIEAVKQALQLPPSVSAALTSKVQSKPADSLNREPKKDATEKSRSSYAPAPAVQVARSTSNSTMPSSPSFSELSASSCSVPQSMTSGHRREGAFPPSSDAGSLDSERKPDRDTTEKLVLSANLTTANTHGVHKQVDDNEDVPQVTIISEPPPPPSPILEEPNTFGPSDRDADADSLRPQHRREHGQAVVMSDNDDDSNENWVAISRVSSPSVSSHHDRSTSLDINNNGTDGESSKTRSEAPSPPPKSFRNSLTTGLRRLSSRSLPRTPSLSSGGSRRSSSVMSKRFSSGSANWGPSSLGGTAPISATTSLGGSANGSAVGSVLDISSTNVERTPSPFVVSTPLPQVPPTRATTVHVDGLAQSYSASTNGHGTTRPPIRRKRQKVVVQWPSAMFCNKIHGTAGKKKLTSSEKCAIYAQKINELYMYDCGLTEWVVETRLRGPNSNPGASGTNKKFPDARSPASAPFTPQPRQTSRSSIISDATFPTRPDATTATDLLSSAHDDDGVYQEDVPPLPYPSLATVQRAAASNVASPLTSNIALMTPAVSLRSLGSNSTLPSMGGGTNHTTTHNTHNHHTHSHLMHTPASTLAPLTNLPTPASSTTSPLSPLSPTAKHTSITSLSSHPSTGGFFASLGRKASLSSAKRPNLGLGLSNLISSSSPSSSISGGLSSPLANGHRLLTKSISGPNGGTKLLAGTSSATTPKSPVAGGLQMNTAAPPSVVPGGPRALVNSNRVQRSKTFMPSTRSPFDGYNGGVGSGGRAGIGAGGIVGGGVNGGSGKYGGNVGIERRPSLWELQINSSSSPSGMTMTAPTSPNPIVPTPHSQNFSSQPHPYANAAHVTTAAHNGGYTPEPAQSLHHHSQPYTPTTAQYNLPQPQQQVYDPQLDPEFIRQVDKLAGLLPHADRNILAGYLRRAGQDVLAIGQYLEDEKNGTLKAY